MEVADELEAKYKRENKKGGKIEAEGRGPTIEKLEQAVEKLDQRIATAEVQSEDRENNKEVALGTSKIVSIRTFTFRFDLGELLANYMYPELHRPPSHGRLQQEVQRTHRAFLLKDFAREVRLGY